MDEYAEYLFLLRVLPKDLTPAELARFKTDYPLPNAAQMLVKTTAVCRDGHWYGVLIFIHKRGVLGHEVIPGWRQHKVDARAVAEQVAERFQDYHEQQRGVRNRGMVADDDDDPNEACP